VILSHQHKFVFIKGAKVGGTSVEIVLSALCGPDDVITPIIPVDERQRIVSGHLPRNYALQKSTEIDYVMRIRDAAIEKLHTVQVPMAKVRFYNHMPVRDVEAALGLALDDYAVICVERNPYAKVISYANWNLQGASYHLGRSMKFDLERTRRAIDEMIASGSVLECKNIERYRRRNGVLDPVVLRLESLDNDLREFVRQRVGVQNSPAIPHAKRGNYEVKPSEVLSPSQVRTLNAMFREEFEFFRYRMLL